MCGVKYWKTTDGRTFQDEKEANDWQERINSDGQEVVYYTVKPLPEEGKKRIAKRIADYVQREISKTDLNDEN